MPILLPANLLPVPAYNPDITLPKQRFYVGLLTPGGVELSGNGYSRAEITEFTLEDFIGPRRANVSAIEFATATGDWPLVSRFGLYDDLGGLLFSGSLSREFRLGPGSTASFPAGGLVFRGEPINSRWKWRAGELSIVPISPQPKTIWERLDED